MAIRRCPGPNAPPGSIFEEEKGVVRVIGVNTGLTIYTACIYSYWFGLGFGFGFGFERVRFTMVRFLRVGGNTYQAISLEHFSHALKTEAGTLQCQTTHNEARV